MRSYAKSIELYDGRGGTWPAASAATCAMPACPSAVLRARRGRPALRRRWQRPYRLRPGQRPRDPGHAPKPVIEAVARSPGEARSTPPSIRARPSWPSVSAGCCPAPRSRVRDVRHRGRADGYAAGARLHRPRKILKFEGHYHGWSDQAFISARPSLNEAGPADEPCRCRLARHAASVLATRWSRLERSRRAASRLRPPCRQIAASSWSR